MFIDNCQRTLKDDFVSEIKSGSKISIAASCFSIYAFQVLKDQLKDIAELRFIFTSPTFVTEKSSKQQREFYIPRLNRERNLYGSEFEIKLRNELSQRAIAKECADWIREKACFKSNRTDNRMMGFVNIDDKSYMPVNGFTTVELGCEKGNNAYTMIQKTSAPESSKLLELFETVWNDNKMMQVVTEEVLDGITNAYKENAPDFLYFVALYNIFKEFLEDLEDTLPNEATGFKNSAIWQKLYNFQRDASLAIINKLEKYNGCILADSVGLGKTFTALSVIMRPGCRGSCNQYGFVRLRDDKTADPLGVRISQLSDLCPFSEVENYQSDANARCEMLIRKVYKKGEGKKLMLHKFAVWKTNKEGSGLFPAYVLHHTDFSCGRKESLKRDIRVSSSEAQIMKFLDEFVSDNIKKGWKSLRFRFNLCVAP